MKKLISIISIISLLFFSIPQINAVEFGLITDIHYDSATHSTGADKLTEFITDMNSWQPDFIIQLGDFVDDGTVGEITIIDAIYDNYTGEREHVFGNHDGTRANWISQVLSTIGESSSYYSFDSNGYHFIVLDSNYTPVYTVGATQQAWLTSDLAGTALDTIVFIHQTLGPNDAEQTITDKAAVRTILENSGKVTTVFNGHHHLNRIETVNGINYYTMNAVLVNDASTYAKVEITASEVYIRGFGGQTTYSDVTRINNATLNNCVIN